jgi:trimethylamine-N-oxide reductase (cytochrome c)
LKNPKLGIKVVHVDPYYNASAQFLPGKWFAPRPTTSVAMAMAIAYVWIKEGLYDKEYVKTHTVGFDKWKAYLVGEEDGIAKTPEWQEEETGVPAKDVRALAREWGRKRVYLAPGGWGNGHGGACRNQTGIQWASTWATCNGVARSTSSSTSPVIPRAGCRAIWKARRCRFRSISACRSCRR